MILKWMPAVFCLAIALLGGPANAATCGPRDQVVERLASTYGETVQSIGLGSNNGIVEIFASDESGSWTITVTSPNGQTCLVASGYAFEAVNMAQEAKGEDV